MKHKFFYLKCCILSVLIIFVVISTIHNVFAEETCSFSSEKECYKTFEDYFFNDPVTAATAYPADYMTHIQSNPAAVLQNPGAYEAVIVQDVAYINQDKQGFSNYLTTKDVSLDVVGDISSYDIASGTIKTGGFEIVGTSVTYPEVLSITLDAITELKAQGNTHFEIGFMGELSYLAPVSSYNDRGTLITSYNSVFLEGNVFSQEDDEGFSKSILITNGNVKFGYDPPKVIEIHNDNKAIIYQDSISVEVGSDTPISLPNGILLKGKANGIKEDSVFILSQNSVYQSKTETIFSTAEKAVIRFSDDIAEGCTSIYCITETDDTLIVDPSYALGYVSITTKDGTYQNVIVKQFETEETKLTLSIQKSDMSTAELSFSKQPPAARGNINGLETNIAHTYSVDDKKYPWLLYNGKPTFGMDGTNQEVMSVLMSKTKIDTEAAALVVASAKLKDKELNTILLNTNDVEKQYALFQGYRTSQGHEKTLDLAELSSLQNIDSVVLWQKVVANTEEYKEIERTFEATKTMPEVQKAILTNVDTITSPSVITAAATPEIKRLIIDKTDFTDGAYSVGEDKKGISFRTVLLEASEDDETLEYALSHMLNRGDIDFYPDSLSKIYFDEEFQKQTEGLDFANRYSVATTAERYLRQSGQEITAETIADATQTIVEQRNAFADYQILNDETYYIPITHEEDQFQNDNLVRFARESGVQDIADPSLKGSTNLEETKAVKEKFLTYVTESDEKGKTTIHFNNHGGPEHQWLMEGQAGVEQSDEMHNPQAISYVELGDALIERGHLSDVTIMIDSCYSNDFKNNLYSYLEKQTTEMPVVITETNRGQVGWGSTTGTGGVFSQALDEVHTPGQPLTGADIFEVESKTFVMQDLSVSIPQTDESIKQAEKTIIELGSTYDEGNAEQPTREENPPTVIIPSTLPTSIIEIAANEEELLENIGMA